MLTRRPATEADDDFARAAHHAAVRDVVERQFGHWDVAAQDDFFVRDWSGGTFEILLWEHEPCGYASIEERDDDVYIREIVIRPPFQNRGIGTAVVLDAVARAASRNVPAVLQTLQANRAADLYRRLGFRETGRTETHILFRREP